MSAIPSQTSATSHTTASAYAQTTTDSLKAQSGTAGVASSSAAQPQSRQAAEEARKDRTLAEFMLMLDDYEPLVRCTKYGMALTE